MTHMIYICWARWVSDLRLSWCVVLLISVLPTVLYSSAILSAMLLLGGVILGFPTALASLLLSNDVVLRARLFRRVVVFTAVPALMLTVIFQADKLTPQMAAPIVRAVELFKKENGAYPDSLTALSPKYLPELPAVRLSVFQPQISYRVREGNSYLTVPSAAGDAYSAYEYNFEERNWAHYN